MASDWKLQSISIKARLRLFFSTAAILMLLGSLLSFMQFRNVSSHAGRVSYAERRITALLRLNNSLITLMSELHRAAEKREPHQFAQEAPRLLATFQRQVADTSSRLQEIAKENERYGLLVASIQSMLDSLPARVAAFVQLADQGDWIALHARLFNQADHTDEVVAALVTQAEADLAGARQRQDEDLEQAEKNAARVIAAAGVLSLVAAIVLGAMVTGSITRPLSDLDAGARALAAGRFDHRVPLIGNDELTHVARIFNQTAGELARLFEEVQRERSIAEAAKADLQQQAQDLARANADLQQFAYSASHDLQEPLRTVTLYSQLLQRQYGPILDTRADEYIGFLLKSSSHMRQLIADLLEYTQASVATNEVQAYTDMGMVLSRVVNSLRSHLREEIAMVTADPLPAVKVREIHVQQLLQNLIGNGLKYHSDQRPEIHVSAEPEPEWWVISVRDNGIGIQPQYAQQIFGIFKRLHGSEYPGTGIGLAICQRIVELYGGRIWVDSDGVRGSTFRFTLPK